MEGLVLLACWTIERATYKHCRTDRCDKPSHDAHFHSHAAGLSTSSFPPMGCSACHRRRRPLSTDLPATDPWGCRAERLLTPLLGTVGGAKLKRIGPWATQPCCEVRHRQATTVELPGRAAAQCLLFKKRGTGDLKRPKGRPSPGPAH